ncbi:transcriptional regulator [Flavobacterium rivuli WB 3.3-2 = DSM 21788]|uniref:Transcriptional regulator n=1 Tax=Flavobacterium rivuli WB 3.3-2 = DSM 21788 TaxID=1121895 RepID=A0A0A2M7L1_9FLAO|nr:response regulator transcription factor [Flavobacterium rivuli]KGO88254.1 transcriptional regulator [Flavobacterium rivuli WB 3.3-2 = DSM 21788]
MFKKIIVAEDIDSISMGLQQLLQNIDGATTTYTKYCDDAYLKIKKAALDNEPFELLITDLSFKITYRNETLTSGEDLIAAVKNDQPNIKVIVYSIDERGYKIRHLIDDMNVDGYVSKGRDSATELLKAVNEVYYGKIYISKHLAHLKKPALVTEMDELDLEIIKLLADGLIQNEIAESLKNNGSKLSSVSSIEKRLIKIKTTLRARNTTHIVSIAKDLGLI